ncbi:hypothetical protein DFH27DRAFT_564226 [Peziza echinospora]|nr:hypothetical protein DFH27DRAFT_564226 [Peziza echinospora]
MVIDYYISHDVSKSSPHFTKHPPASRLSANMVQVAVIGSGNLGIKIIKAILRRPQHTLKVLSRRPRPDIEAEGAEVAIIDFENPSTIVNALTGIHTLISVVFDYDPANFERTQIILIDAAKEAGVTRFAPSEWCWSEEFNNYSDWYTPKRAIMKHVRESGLEYTAFRPGHYLNRLAFGSPHPEVLKLVFGGSQPFEIEPSFSAAHRGEVLEVPGTGNVKFNLTLISDIGELVAESLDKKWAPESGMGVVTTYNELIQIWEKASGRKITPKYVPLEELEQRLKDAGPNPHWSVFLSLEFKVGLAKGYFYMPPTLNELTGYKPTTVEEFVARWWSPVETKA